MTFPYTDEELRKFRDVQRLAYDSAIAVEAELEVGMTEADVCELLEQAQRAANVHQVFHMPFAWFGDRTLLDPAWAPDVASEEAFAELSTRPPEGPGFFASDTRLEHGMPVIIDLAPIVDGYSSDIGYSCITGDNAVYDELFAGLEPIRDHLLAGVRAGATLRELYHEVDTIIAEHHWVNCHQHYPDRSLGHLVFRVGPDPDRASPIPGFGTAAAETLLTTGLEAMATGGCYPVWNDSDYADHPAAPGLWAVEPHIGRDGIGVKFEELLVVTDDHAYWLDDELPHTRAWRAHAS
jgi:Xaa-Pro aminopeptidase